MNTWGTLENFFSNEDKSKLQAKAIDVLERCFSTKDSEKRLDAFLKCEEELKTGIGYSLSESKPVIMPDGSIGMVDTYWLNSVSSLILLEMMYSLRQNIPIVKCPICSKFFFANNNGIQYCDNIYKDGKTCRQIGAKKYFNQKLKSDELLLLYDKTYQATYYKRSKTSNEKEREELSERLKFLKEQRSKYKKGEINSEEFAKVLN